MICSSGHQPLEGIFRDFKKFTAKKIVEELDTIFESRRQWILGLFGDIGMGLSRVKNYKVWQDGNHPVQLTKAKFTHEKLDYIHNNPVAAEIVAEPEHYLYSSARDYYCNIQGYLNIEFLR